MQSSLILLVFAVGLRSQWGDLFHVVRRPRLFLSGIVAVNVVVPAVAVTMVVLLPIAPVTKAGIVAMAAAPMAPFLPAKMLKLGAAQPFATGFYVALIITAIPVVPATVWLIGRLTGHQVGLPVDELALFVLTSVLLPLLAGRLVAGVVGERAATLAKLATNAAYVILLPIVLLLLVKTGGGIAALVGDGTLVAIAVTVLVGLLMGHALGGPEPANRRATAQAAAMRHPGIAAMFLRDNSADQHAMLAVVLFLLLSVIISAFYDAWITKRDRAAGGETPHEAL
ncbi:MAG TPA: hypothetical protein VI168_17005 [Croceibacterium sp.]